MSRQVITSGLKQGGSGGHSGSTAANRVSTILVGKGKSQLAQTPMRRASSIESQRCIPLLCTTMVSLLNGVNGAGRGARTTRSRSSTSSSIRLLVYIFSAICHLCWSTIHCPLSSPGGGRV